MKPRNRYEVWKSDRDGQWYWRLKAHNNEVICQSEGYTTRQAALKGIRSVRLFGLLSRVVEL